MRQFRFRLQRLLKLKAYTEQEWEIKLGRATAECLQVEQQIDEALNSMASAFKKAHPAGQVLDMGYLSSTQLYMDRLGGKVEQLEDELVVKEAARRDVQAGYLEASRERKVLDKLKERREQEFYKNERDEELKELDDINNSSFIRQRRDKG